MPREPCVYILANRRRGTLYTGVTSNLGERVFRHREGLTPGFASRYGCNRLVFYESYERMTLSRETRWVPSPCSASEAAADRLDGAEGLALDARDLDQAADRIAGHAEVMLHRDLGGVLDRLVRTAERGA